MNRLVFVYGTLKSGFPNHHLNGGQRLPGIYKTCLAYPLYLVGERQSPWLVDDSGVGQQVIGEIYRLDPQNLAEMDRLERGEAKDGYRRRKMELIGMEDGRILVAEAYLKPREQFMALPTDAIQSGPHEEYGPELAARYRSR